MSARASFAGLDPFRLTEVQLTDTELGHGSYATVLQLDYMGLKCAGKKIHELLLKQGDSAYTVRRFEEECRLLSQVRHPNIVQFLGVHFQEGVTAPILVMEFLPTNLTSCIEQYGILPKEISYSILHDVALGLCYLHGQTPPIIHRDLSSNNVLLSPNMTAKISDLGVARILNLTPLQVSRMTETPGTPAYMPPEVMVASPKYDTSIDLFSYGIMMVHVFSGCWPVPQVGPNRTEPGKLIPVTEAERREVFLRAIGDDHPLMKLILKCIDNHPRARPQAREIVERLAEMVLQFPANFINRLDLLSCIKSDEEQKRALTEEVERRHDELKEKNELIEQLQAANQELLRTFDEDCETKVTLSEDLARTLAEKSELESKLRAKEKEKMEYIAAAEANRRMLKREIEKKNVELVRLREKVEESRKIVRKHELEIIQLKLDHQSRGPTRLLGRAENRSVALEDSTGSAEVHVVSVTQHEDHGGAHKVRLHCLSNCTIM